MSRRSTLVLTIVVAAVAAIATASASRARSDRSPDPGYVTGTDGVAVHVSTDDPQKVREYWTPERMRSAEPMPMPTDKP